MDFDECLRSQKIVKMTPDDRIIDKEMEGSLYDLRRARDSIIIKDFKWASIQAYYSMFHAGKALLIKAGFREKSHGCLIVGLRALYVENGKITNGMVQNLEDSMFVRMDADYGLVFSEQTASIMVENAERFYKECERVLGQ